MGVAGGTTTTRTTLMEVVVVAARGRTAMAQEVTITPAMAIAVGGEGVPVGILPAIEPPRTMADMGVMVHHQGVVVEDTVLLLAAVVADAVATATAQAISTAHLHLLLNLTTLTARAQLTVLGPVVARGAMEGTEVTAVVEGDTAGMVLVEVEEVMAVTAPLPPLPRRMALLPQQPLPRDTVGTVRLRATGTSRVTSPEGVPLTIAQGDEVGAGKRPHCAADMSSI